MPTVVRVVDGRHTHCMPTAVLCMLRPPYSGTYGAMAL